jgi:arylsulfate sulfotransferase
MFTTWIQWLKRSGYRDPAVPSRNPRKTRMTALRRHFFRPWLEALEDRTLPSALPVARIAGISVSLAPSEPSPQLVGDQIVWTATAESSVSDLVYQFRVGAAGGPLQVVRDFSANNIFTWAPLQEGAYDVAVTVKEGFAGTDTTSAVVSDTVNPRATGANPVVTPTANPLVALYSAPSSSASTIHVDFRPVDAPGAPWTSTDTKTTVPGQSTNFLVAGMLANTTYEMVGVTSGGSLAPAYFTTGTPPAILRFPHFSVVQGPDPSSDLSQNMVLHFAFNGPTPNVNILATDLAGHVDWYYDPVASGLASELGTSLVPGGTVLLLGVTPGSLLGPLDNNVLREIDLAGNTLRETNLNAVNSELAARGQPAVIGFHHDAERLPNGDTVILSHIRETILVGGIPTNYLGDMVIVLDQDFQVAWTWNAFDFLDTSRLPPDGEGPADWLHSNAVNWSPADGNLIVSVRHQDWVIKIDYQSGEGDGHVVWRLGQGGDFTVHSTDPDPWFSHQHNAHYLDDGTLILFDNGNTRVDSGDPARNHHSRGQVWSLDEQTLQATLVVNADMGNYSSSLGAAQKLASGNYVFTSGNEQPPTPAIGQSIEVLPDGTKTYSLGIDVTEYRSYRMSDLYAQAAASTRFTVLTNGDSGPGSLRSAIALAQSGDQIVFAPSLQRQTITLASQLDISKSLDIEGPGAGLLAVSGNHHSRVFSISGGVTVTLAGMTITAGLAVGAAGTGGGILNTGSNLTVANDILSDNQARGVGGNGSAGAIYNISGATLIVTHSLFLHNQALGSNAATGGAIHNTGSTASITDSTFTRNQAHGGDGPGANGFTRGGAIYNITAGLTVANCTFTDNQAIAGNGGVGGGGVLDLASGGGITNADRGILLVTGSLFTGNEAIGGSNATVGTSTMVGIGLGGGLANAGVATVTESTFDHNEARGGSGNMGGSGFAQVGIAWGGGINTAAANASGTAVMLTLCNVTLRNNRAVGGAGNTGGTIVGEGIGGGLVADGSGGAPSSTATVSNSTIADNEAIGGNGSPDGNGSIARGGGLANIFGATLAISGSTLTGNQAFGGDGDAGGSGGAGLGGGVFNDGPSANPTNLGAPTVLTVMGSTIADNHAQGGAAGAGGGSAGRGAGGGIASAGILTVLGSSLAHNRALGHDGDGGANGGDGLGGGLYVAGGTASILNTDIQHNRALGGDGDAGGNGGNGLGGGIYVGAGTVVVSASDISDNQAVGGLGDGAGTDGLGLGGGVYNLGTFLRDAATVIRHNRASDGNDDCFGC